MSIINLIRTSIYSLKSHKLRAFLTMIGIIIGISSVVTILSIGNGLKQEVLKSSQDTSANKINISFNPESMTTDINLIEPFNKSDIYNLQKIEGIQKIQECTGGSMGESSFLMKDVSYFDKKSSIILDSYENKNLNVEYGTGFKDEDGERKLIILNQKVAKTLFDDPQTSIGRGVAINGVTYEVIGILADSGSFSLANSYSYISKESKESMSVDNTITSIDVYILPNEDKQEVFENINKELMSSHPNLQGKYELQDPQAITEAFEKIIGGLTTFIAFVTGISLFVGGVGVMNIMYVSVSERKREIGIRRAIGATPRSILFQFLFEAIMVTGIGGLIGILFGYIFAKILGVFLPFTPVLSVGSFTGATLTSVTVGIIFGIIPASNAAKLDPIKAIYK